MKNFPPAAVGIITTEFLSRPVLRKWTAYCSILTLVWTVNLFNSEPLLAQQQSANRSIWNSMSPAALATEARLKQALPPELAAARKFSDASALLNARGFDIVLTDSAQDDAFAEDDDWRLIGNPRQIGQQLARFCESRNAVYEVNREGAIRIISRDEVYDAEHLQSIVYRVDRLAADQDSLNRLAENLRASAAYEYCEYDNNITPVIQSEHRLLVVSIHYEGYLKVRQLLQDLVNGASAPLGRPHPLATANRGSLSNLVSVPPAVQQPTRRLNPARITPAASGGVF